MKGIHVTSEIKPLNKVLLHRPGKELLNLTPDTLGELLFDDIPFLKVAQEEHVLLEQSLIPRRILHNRGYTLIQRTRNHPLHHVLSARGDVGENEQNQPSRELHTHALVLDRLLVLNEGGERVQQTLIQHGLDGLEREHGEAGEEAHCQHVVLV